ncbi:MAG: hypothetical protein ABIQ95_06160 [Bdellovibrionia bacterium]
MNKYNVIKLNVINRIFAILTLILITGCSSKPDDRQSNTANIPAPPTEPTHLDPEPVPVAQAIGWTEVLIVANSAKTRVGTGAHFTTSRNACGKEAYGGIGLEAWNKLANALNKAIEKEPLREEYCVSTPDPTPEGKMPPYMDGTVEVKTATGTVRNIFQLRGDQICGTIPDARASDDLLSAVSKIIAEADKEDCPNGWGSN